MKTFIKYFLFLCVPLVSGSSQSSDYSYNEHTLHATIKNLSGIKYASLYIEQREPAFIIKSSSPDTERKNYKIEVAENEVEEDDEVTFPKKHVEHRSSAASILFAQTLGRFFSGGKRILPFYTFSSYSLSYRYLIFRAFRI